jgi:ABC-type transport system involved in multi-copper enzyme maturation permease subunit
MSWLSETILIAGREIKKNFRSLKGIILLIISLLGASGIALVRAWLAKQDLLKGVPQEAIHDTFRKGLMQAGFPEDTANYISNAPPMLYGMMWLSVWMTPLIIAIIGFDGISGELQNRTVRYWNVRSRRWAYYLGKVLGMWAVVSVFTLMLHVAVLSVAIGFGIAPSTDILQWGLRLYAVTVPIAGAWCGISMLVSSNFRVPMLSLLATCVVFFVLWLLKGVGLVLESMQDAKERTHHALVYLYPNTYDEMLLSPKPQLILQGIGLLLLFLLVTTGVGSFIFQKRDV